MATWISALLFAVGGSVWLYSRFMRQTGNNTKTSLIVAAIAFIFLYAIFWAIFDFAIGFTN